MSWSPEGEWIPFPTYAESEESAFEMVVAGRLADGDVAVMMVEAGGSENAFYYYEDGAKKVTEEVLADGLDACKVWIKESIALQRQLVAAAAEGRLEVRQRRGGDGLRLARGCGGVGLQLWRCGQRQVLGRLHETRHRA